MGRSNSPALDGRPVRFTLSTFVIRQITGLAGFVLFFFLALAVAALATWNVMDPSYSYATSNAPTNILGAYGAIFADVVMQALGLSSVIVMLPVVAWALALVSGRKLHRLPARLAAWVGGAALAAAAVGCLPEPLTWPIPNGIGGVIGDMILRFPALFVGAYPSGVFGAVVGTVFAVPAIWCMLFAAGLIGNSIDDFDFEEDEEDDIPSRMRAVGDDAEDDEPRFLAFGVVIHMWYNAKARLRRLFGMGPRQRRDHAFDAPYDFNDDEFGRLNEPARAKTAASRSERLEPSMDGSPSRRVISAPPISVGDADHDDDDNDVPFDVDPRRPAGILPDDDDVIRPIGSRASPSNAGHRVIPPAPRPKPGIRAEREAQTSFIRPQGFQLPAVHLLAEPKAVVRDSTLSADALEQNARMLEGVLEDFGVKGEIIHVRPGPVVTLYELEPAPGIKSSRVIGLADDIARSMSAIAARVAVVPGRNAIGIELPNNIRETVYLREMIASRDFETSKAKLAMALGKTIGGEPVIADLAKMPHLLVAGTTGSGKSVAINTMILSLLYRMTPEQCRLIMIDPKMLELSVYDGIPHLLSPVVTDPKKAVVALKWTVREMEERYKKMSKIGVRNIDGFNTRVEQAAAKGEAISRTVQTGFDRATGEAMYETEEFDLKPLPYIVVIIDEMADLMMVAGKDIEGAVQRLAQMARAAGIHVIMATQRPSVDVITGTIKANFPTRISFQVTSKIDSRTILGEQGAEQLLGMGDMLYMAGGGRIQRVHGPFVADGEVEDIVAYLKTQGSPQYLDAITADSDEDDEDGDGPVGTGNLSDSDDPYDQAVAVVLRDGKASTSYVQRRLGIGYNRAASLIERMEQEGIIGPANHAGKREILVPTEADILDR
ncbi:MULTISPECIES: FtsK/SpoIIIE family DNA translocase [Rhizobium]|uniref:DNA translocase FtsK n=1 Tax=Rhizobium rhododendri TaxID=2506430 RepID=A0ABY8IFK3_9HYPH|nr:MULTISPECIES: DNA translocase FtsK [Rhizobium]MBZ5760759.1 DNA translocase FtsK [Rhizobium sp. VS19-DR96]MBZ5765457.1 DNA translocase FtsK [Rhizobium sp. VS19-DR129.2]MBZ5774376.1 DNA translocase FtsK [Rhizobium sp. VS19-DRK62.2]MBZ5784594.1 DNA translocase FtsK [Rhizobium sp. VS19-DR121]MBZ5801206.1 DNA translocase FtsK [Rhizobium sp. VS19-DR181]